MSSWPWPSSDSTEKIIPAFVAALQGASDVSRNQRAKIETKSGANVNYSYADLDAVLEQVKPVLTTNGLAITTPATSAGVYTVVMHTSGEWLSFPALEFKPTQQTPQGQGSALTYGRRYSVLGVLNIATEDDDGKAASKPADPLVSSTQLKAIGASLRKLVGEDREAGLAFIAEAAGRTVTSSKELTTKEAAAVLNALRDAVPQDEAA
jgi:hypothetical protein